MFEPQMPGVREVARKAGLTLEMADTGDSSSAYDGAFETIVRTQCQALLVMDSPSFARDRKLIIEHAARASVPAIYAAASNAREGGLMSYGTTALDLDRQVARQIDKILRGAKPGELPVEQPSRYELVVNLATARAPAQATAWIGLADPAHAVALLAGLRASLGERVSAFELVSRPCLEAVLAHDPAARDPLPGPHAWYVLAEFADAGEQSPLEARVAQALGASAEVDDAALAANVAQARTLWKLRETIPEAQFANVKHDVSVPISRVPELIRLAGTALQAAFPGVPLYAFGHIGDGNVHYNVGDAGLLARRDEINAIVFKAVAALGGSISAEHGLGQLKREAIRAHKDPLELELMRALKRTLDPLGLMNPGKVL
jgi:hypothetical protein